MFFPGENPLKINDLERISFILRDFRAILCVSCVKFTRRYSVVVTIRAGQVQLDHLVPQGMPAEAQRLRGNCHVAGGRL